MTEYFIGWFVSFLLYILYKKNYDRIDDEDDHPFAWVYVIISVVVGGILTAILVITGLFWFWRNVIFS